MSDPKSDSSDLQSDPKDDVQFTFEPISPPPPPVKKGFLSKFGPIGLMAMQVPLDKFQQKEGSVQQALEDYKSQIRVR